METKNIMIKSEFTRMVISLHTTTYYGLYIDFSQEIEGDNFSITLRINYDNSTLDGIPEILERIKDIDRKKIFVHFERVWQTENDSTEQTRDLLRNVMKRFIKAGFCVGQGTFRGYPYSCPSDINNSIVINYDGSIHKCNGRTLSSLTKYGILNDDGSLDIDEKSISKTTFCSNF
jgi:putative regulatory protein